MSKHILVVNAENAPNPMLFVVISYLAENQQSNKITTLLVITKTHN